MTELIQSRDPNPSEALAIMRVQVAAFRRQLAAYQGYRATRAAWLIFVVGLFGAFILAARMHWLPRPSSWIMIPAIILVSYGLCRLWSRYHFRACAAVYKECLKGDRSLHLEADGIVSRKSGVVSSISWPAIHDIVMTKDGLLIYLSPIETMSWPKAAFESQDVEGFAAELMRRWQAHRAPAGAAA
jgi:hypothetical protein